MVLGSTALMRSGLISLQMAVSAVHTAGKRTRQHRCRGCGTLLACSSQGGIAQACTLSISTAHGAVA